MAAQRVIVLKGGPLDGVAHELHLNWPAPGKLALPNEQRTEEYWYVVDPDERTAQYERTDAIEPARHS